MAAKQGRKTAGGQLGKDDGNVSWPKVQRTMKAYGQAGHETVKLEGEVQCPFYRMRPNGKRGAEVLRR